MEYFTSAVQTDTDAYFAQFDDDAVVEDEGREHRGIAEIRKWRSEVPTVHYDVPSIDHDGHTALAKVEISGEFPGSPVILTFAFGFTEAGRIASLKIRAQPSSVAPHG